MGGSGLYRGLIGIPFREKFAPARTWFRMPLRPTLPPSRRRSAQGHGLARGSQGRIPHRALHVGRRGAGGRSFSCHPLRHVQRKSPATQSQGLGQLSDLGGKREVTPCAARQVGKSPRTWNIVGSGWSVNRPRSGFGGRRRGRWHRRGEPRVLQSNDYRCAERVLLLWTLIWNGLGGVAATNLGHHGDPAQPIPSRGHRQQASLCQAPRRQT